MKFVLRLAGAGGSSNPANELGHFVLLIALFIGKGGVAGLGPSSPVTPPSMSSDNQVTHERLLEVLSYDPESGHFRWLAGKVVKFPAGHVTVKGYRKIAIDFRLYRAHRLAWFYVNGVWPKLQLDHINGDRDDNRISNLREATNGENCQNRKISSANKSGYKGVSFVRNSGKWNAEFYLDGIKHRLGYFDDVHEAGAAVSRKRRELHGEFAKD